MISSIVCIFLLLQGIAAQFVGLPPYVPVPPYGAGGYGAYDYQSLKYLSEYGSYPNVYNSIGPNQFASNPFISNPFEPIPNIAYPFLTNPFIPNPHTTNPFIPNPHTTNPFSPIFNPSFNSLYPAVPYVLTPNHTVANYLSLNPFVANHFLSNPFPENPLATNPFLSVGLLF